MLRVRNLIPGHLFSAVDRFPRHDSGQRALRGRERGVLELARPRPVDERVDCVRCDIALGHDLYRGIAALLPGVHLVTPARRIDRALLADEGLADVLETSGRDLVRAIAEHYSVRELERGGQVIHDVADIGAHLPAAVAARFYRMRSHKPVHDVEVMAVLLDDDVAALLSIEQPVA